ncbi:MAG: gliding motility protein GldG [Gammaproteobacteria bacterium]|nr:MAG: gliding motility protein GldG [Gammaproteobacteria bacterium]RKZ39246.1 MAG: gliding motility protein GldG [Gammaproteobacteria bacterium]RKZ74218.1 MAG: gliding motility protein GldG [Gammaproteobacteria bacterium]
MNIKILTTSGLLIAIALLLAVNIISDKTLKTARLDLTENQLYTLSEGSKNILKNLEEPVTLRFFLSQKLATSLPGINSYTIRVRELLEEYQRAAGNNIKLQIVDPEPFSEAEDQAEGYGLQGVPVDSSNTMFYFGLAATSSTDDEESIPFFTPNRAEFLEYDLTKLIYQLANPKQKVVGLMSSLPIQGNTKASLFPTQNAVEPWMIVDHLKQLFEVQNVETDVEVIPDDVDILMIVHPKDFSDSTLYAIDQFVLKGGRVIVFADPYSEAYVPPTDPKNPFAAMQAPRNSDLSKLFDAWGLEIASDKVVGNLRTAQKVQVKKANRATVITYPVWMDLDGEQYFNTEDIITGKLGNIVLATPGAIVEKGDVETEIIPLIVSGEKSMQIETSKLGFFAEPENLVREFKPEGKFTLAARITGKVKTAFPDGKPKDNESDESEISDQPESDSQHLTESVESINLIVVADTDLLEDKFWVQVQNIFGQRVALPHAANATLVSNALDNLSGSNDLISVRNRGNFARSFTLVEEIQQEAEQQFREKEKELQARLQEADQKIRDLQKQKQKGNELMLSVQQEQEIDRFRAEKIKIRKELRNVQHELQKNIESLETQMKFINIGLMPLLIGFVGISLGFLSRRQRKKTLQMVKG